MCFARCRNVGASSVGSTSPMSVAFGLIADTIARACIVSPLSSTTPVARPSSISTRVTFAFFSTVTPCCPAIARHRGRERAGPAPRRDAAAHRHRVGGDAAHEHRAGASRPRSRRVAKDRVRGDCGTEQIGLEPFRNQIAHRHRHPPGQLRKLPAAQRARLPAEIEQMPPVTPAGSVERQGRVTIELRHQARGPLQRLLEFDPPAGV